MIEKNCIFHIPNHLNTKEVSGSQIRPLKMISAFESNGYNVDVIMGYGKERQQQIRTVKNNIRNGKKYDFLYSESSTMPTLLTEKNHMPTYPFLDFSFFKFCKKNNIKIGLFYRDIYWKFPLYKKIVKKPLSWLAIMMYQYDLIQYKKLVDILFLPSLKMQKYIGKKAKCFSTFALPPGADDNNIENIRNDLFTLLYVGGIKRNLYDLTTLLKAIASNEKITLYLCCRENEWNEEKSYYTQFLTNRVKIIHTSGTGLIPYYQKADMCCLITNVSEYRSFAMPIKLFEYLSYEKPILITEGSVSAEFVKQNQIGFVVQNDVQDVKAKLDFLSNNHEQIEALNEQIHLVHKQNTWSERAKTVIALLK